ncbi:type III polyketide synthase [Goodfellowiella coeruleoviolacea]|uniref:Naringenin-chalcone synthase n=1 Tax=Goodfellowiella coeruleoviolacea TaxID=334858 RepID=A0AAE3GAR3_9PSEU|nr:type III polyketide synthase [Goodfellowiella coeruleoviolacea]MCP2163857.1 putative naringenin-chalcone synthase [Goodfellowiella coeruleoviolacea]
MVIAAITGLGSALPAGFDQRALWEGYFRRHFTDNRFAERIFASAGVRRRHSVLDPLREDVSGWSTEARMRRYRREAPPLGHRAATAALADAGVPAEDVGLLAVASCTGYGTPGLDIQLASSLRLAPETQRLFVGHMGCFAALPALGSVADFVVARHRPAVLLCLELTTLHLQPPTAETQQVVSHALFGDAAVALVLQPVADRRAGSGSRPDTHRPVHPAPRLDLVDLAALTDITTRDHMTWDVTDLGFRMGLSPRVPDVLARHVGPVVKNLVARNGLDLPDVRAWAVHPGGPRILDTVQQRLGLPASALTASRSVLAERGNCSSATVLLVLDELIRDGTLDRGGPVVAMAFGPGLTLYAALLHGSARPPAQPS